MKLKSKLGPDRFDGNKEEHIHSECNECHEIEDNTQNAKAQTEVMIEASGYTLQEVALGVAAMDKLWETGSTTKSGMA